MKFTKSKVRMMSHLGSCGAYGYAMTTLPEADARVVACTADLCFYSGLERFQRLYPESLYNVGIAEQNLVGIAAGLQRDWHMRAIGHMLLPMRHSLVRGRWIRSRSIWHICSCRCG